MPAAKSAPTLGGLSSTGIWLSRHTNPYTCIYKSRARGEYPEQMEQRAEKLFIHHDEQAHAHSSGGVTRRENAMTYPLLPTSAPASGV